MVILYLNKKTKKKLKRLIKFINHKNIYFYLLLFYFY